MGLSRTRTDEILEGWKMSSHSAQRPAAPPAHDRSRAGLPLGLVAASALVILALVVGSRLLSSGPGPVLPAVGASPSAAATPATTPAPTASAAPRPSPSVTASAAAGSPSPADVAAARQVVDTYTAKLKAGDTTGAWQMLADKERLKYPSNAEWAVERYQFFQGVKSYTVTPNPEDVNPIRAWLTGTNGAAIDLAHAVLVEVHYDFGRPATPADWDLYIVNPTVGGLEIYSVR